MIKRVCMAILLCSSALSGGNVTEDPGGAGEFEVRATGSTKKAAFAGEWEQDLKRILERLKKPKRRRIASFEGIWNDVAPLAALYRSVASEGGDALDKLAKQLDESGELAYGSTFDAKSFEEKQESLERFIGSKLCLDAQWIKKDEIKLYCAEALKTVRSEPGRRISVRRLFYIVLVVSALSLEQRDALNLLVSVIKKDKRLCGERIARALDYEEKSCFVLAARLLTVVRNPYEWTSLAAWAASPGG